jgi:hypothetical protein
VRQRDNDISFFPSAIDVAVCNGDLLEGIAAINTGLNSPAAANSARKRKSAARAVAGPAMSLLVLVIDTHGI